MNETNSTPADELGTRPPVRKAAKKKPNRSYLNELNGLKNRVATALKLLRREPATAAISAELKAAAIEFLEEGN